jgi:hypothetical protein
VRALWGASDPRAAGIQVSDGTSWKTAAAAGAGCAAATASVRGFLAAEADCAVRVDSSTRKVRASLRRRASPSVLTCHE